MSNSVNHGQGAATTGGTGPLSIDGEEVVFHEVVPLGPAKLDRKEPVASGQRGHQQRRR